MVATGARYGTQLDLVDSISTLNILSIGLCRTDETCPLLAIG